MTSTNRSLFRAAALSYYASPSDETPVSPAATPSLLAATQRVLWLAWRLVVALVTAPPVLWRKRVPVVLQMSTTECAAACLAMVLRYYGRMVTLDEMTEEMGIGRDGATALTIAESARQHGLVVRAYTGEPSMLAALPVPAILHWSFAHFVVLERWQPGGAIIIDPAHGRQTVTAEEFDRHFTGVVLTLQPGTNFERRRQTTGGSIWRQQIQRLLLSSGAWRTGLAVLVATLLVQALALALPWLTQRMVDTVVPQRQIGLIPLLGAGIASVVLMQLVVGLARRMLLIRLQVGVDTQLMMGFLEHLLALPYRFFQQRTSGDLLMRLSSNTVMRELLTTQTIGALMDGLMVILFLAVLVVKAPVYGLVTLVIGMVQVTLLLLSTNRMNDLAQRYLATQAKAQAYLVEALAGVHLVKAMGAEGRVLERWRTLHQTALAVSVDKQQLSALIQTLLDGLQMAAPLVLLLLGAHQVLNGDLSLGEMLALNALAVGFLAPLDALVGSAQQFQTVGAHLQRLGDVLGAQREAAGSEAPRLTGAIELENVSYRHDRHSAPILQDISVSIAPGQKVAIVGRSGSGKSTLARLLMGLAEPNAGEIRFDGTPISQLDRGALRRQIGAVLQEVFLFSGSIRQNIAFGLDTYTLDDLLAATKLACIDRDIAQMPMDFETMVAEGGAGLSGGQRQRLALARAIIRRPALLILDEATSHLDTATEAQIQQNLAGLGCTQIVIAHRLSTVQSADLILVLDKGQIVERGTHAELLAQNGLYASLWSSSVATEVSQ